MRVVSLCPSITNLIFDLGAAESLVGITKWCIHPVEGVAAIEKVGGTKDPKIERIIELEPDWVFLNQEENRKEDFEALEQAGIRCHVTFPLNAREAAEAVLSIGEALDCLEKAEVLAEQIHHSCEAVISKREAGPFLRWAYLIWRKPWMAVGSGNYVDGLISEAGGQNIFADHDDAYPAVTGQQLAEAKPDLVFLSSEPFPFKEKHITELAAESGLPPQIFVLCDGELLSWHGSHTAKGLLYARQLMDHLPR